MSAKSFFVALGKIIKKNAPSILIAAGIGGMGTAMYFTAKDTRKALDKLAEAENAKGEELTLNEKARILLPTYADALIIFTVSGALIVGGNRVQLKRTAAAIAGYEIVTKAHQELWESVKKNCSNDTVDAIKANIAKKRLDSHPIEENESNIIITGDGDYLCYDCISDRYFRSNQNKVQHAVNEINRRLLHERYLNLNEFYDEIGLPHCDAGYLLGWNVERLSDLLEVDCSSTQIAPNGEPCLVLNYTVEPGYDFRD